MIMARRKLPGQRARVGSAERKRWPRSAFLRPGARKYPVVERRGGKLVRTERAAGAARKRAILQKNKAVEREARTLENRFRRRRGAKPISAPKWSK